MLEAFQVEAREHSSLWVFNTHGYINNTGGEAITKKFQEVFAKGGRKFLFDLADSRIINSIGISHLIEILERILESKGELAFCNCAPIIEKTFKIMGINQYANIYKTPEEAMSEMLGTS